MSATNLTIAIAIATSGRRHLLTETVGYMAGQTRPADEFIICPAKAEDADEGALRQLVPSLKIVTGPIGSSHQRNTIIASSNADIIIFFDDDFLPALDYLEKLEHLFTDNSDIVVATGDVLADGILGPGLEFHKGVSILEGERNAVVTISISPTFNGYGCNMAVRLAPVRRYGLKFDENLPFYAWLEDLDFSRQLAPYGRVVKASNLRGVHLGTKVGRSPGVRLGYSQIANRVHIMGKGNMSWWQAWRGAFNNITANLLKSFRPEPWVDRRGRLKGNFIALSDLLLGRLDTKKIIDL